MTLFCLLCCAWAAQAQMWNGQDTLYGNEWIDFSKTYYKIRVADDGIYRLNFQSLTAANFPVADVPASQLRLYREGREVPLFTSTESAFGSGDYLEFYGEKNRGSVDAYLFGDAATEQVNPLFSMFNDTAAYYLTWTASGQGLRFAAVTNDLTNLPPKEDYCWQTLQQVFSDGHFKRRISEEITYSWFDGNGYARNQNVLHTTTIVPAKLYTDGPPATLTVRYACDLDEHHQRLTVNDNLFAEDEFSGWKVVERTAPVELNLLGANTTVKLQSVSGGNDRSALSLVTLRYPRQFDFDNANQATFQLDAASQDQYLEIQGFDANGTPPLLFDLTNRTRLETTLEGTVVKARLGPSTAERRLVLVAAAALKTPLPLRSMQFRDYRNLNADYIIVTNPVLQSDPTAAGADHVAAYATYRSSAAGGSHQVAVVDVNELYEQFAYGIRFHPLSIRNFLHWTKKNWPNPRFVLLIGKAQDYTEFRSPTAQTNLLHSLFFVPAYGTPAADVPFTLRTNHIATPIMAIGRLAVTRPAEIAGYLQKVQDHEQQLSLASQTIEDKAWMKRVIHNSGGFSGESAVIRNYVNDMGSTLTNNRFGADVRTFYKTSNDPIQLSSYEQMLDLINGGVSLWTIFGHSSPFAVDFDIGTPDAYNNTGRYPLLLVMGCFSGNASTSQQGIGEQFVLAPQRGAIAYMASVNYGFIDALHTYGRQYYEQLGGADYGRSIGEAVQHTLGNLQGNNYASLIAVLHQNLLQGDPAVKIHAHPGPDYLPDPQTVKFDPNPVGLEQATFQLNFDVANIGENTGGQLALQVEQRRPDNSVISRILDTIPAPPNRSSHQYTIPTAGSQIGFNRFFITLDPQDQIAEKPAAAEMNNDLIATTGEKGLDVYFYANDVQPVYPPAYGIVRSPGVALRASTLNTNAPVQRYLFEFDTLETFDSPLRQSTQLVQAGGLLEWQPTGTLRDSTVYYWRVARDSLVNGSVVWRQQSFIYLAGSAAGWNQSHYGQYAEGVFSNLLPIDSTRQLEFQDNAAFLINKVAYRDQNRYPGFQNIYYQNFLGDYGFNVRGVNDGVVMTLINPNTGRFVPNPEQGNNNHDAPENRFLYVFNTRDSLERIKLMEFIQTGIPNGYYAGLLAFSRVSDPEGYAPHRWAADSVTYGKNLFQVLEGQGAQEVRTLATYFPGAPHPYGLIFRKNDPLFPAIDTIVNHPDSAISLRREFLTKWSVGLLETPLIGPVKAWKSIHWQHEAYDDASDETILTVLAHREGQPDSVLLQLSNTFDTSLAFISATEFPRLKLRYDVRDTLTRSATQPRYLRVLYEGIPEGALHPVLHYTFYRDTLQQGETMRSSIAFANVSDAPMDSVLVKFRVENGAGVSQDYFRKLRPLPVGDTLLLRFETPTLPLNGPYRLLVDVNPNNHQPELYHFNNITVRDFFVARDQRNPLLDVTFDGTHILDGDLISPKPEIVLSLKDDNRYLALSDTATFTLTLIQPDGSQRSIPFNDPALLFLPANPANLQQKNQARLEWRPTFTQDGDYRLLVNGRDASGNASAQLDWSVAFRVITKSSLSNVLNYPNPFSTSTCFVYTMTGAETPTHFRIQIMTVSGRVVREITEAEFGPLRAGTHRSDFCWDGKDEYGDQLANGVYLYRLKARKADGSDFEFFENTGQDGYFKHGFGKMVLMR